MHVEQLPYEEENQQMLEVTQTVLMVSEDAKKFHKQVNFLLKKQDLFLKYQSKYFSSFSPFFFL